MRPRLFTVEEVNALLPQVSNLLLQMQESKTKHDKLQERVTEFAYRMGSNGHLLEKEYNEARQELAQASTALRDLINRASDLGCEVKDVDLGLVDFRAERAGREVYLCWKLGEPGVGWWHDLEAGFAGRRPLD